MSLSTTNLSYASATSNEVLYAAYGCSCPACMSLAQSADGSASNKLVTAAAAVGVHADVRGAELIAQTQNADGSYSFSGDRNVDAVLIGSRWTGSNLTFSFPEDGAYRSGDDLGVNLIPFNDLQKAAARASFRLVEGYTNLTFTEVSPDAAEESTFRLAQTQSYNLGSAQGGFPDMVANEGGQIWFGRTQQPFYEAPQKGNWGYATMMHEIGHTLGLKHGMDDYTNVDIGSIFGDGSQRFGSRALEYDKDGQAWSLMTYTSAPDIVALFNGEDRNQAQSYMQFDIAALQYLYGANYTTNVGDTVYRWDATTGEKSINGVGQGAATGNKVFETIWDGGGIDTYDFSNYAGGVIADLRPGQFSTLSPEQLANNAAFVGGASPTIGNVGNALLYQNNTASLIENAIGGSGSDRLIGNQVDNVLIGLGGDDLLVGGAGSDTLVGGVGNDIADFTGASTGISVVMNDGARDITVANGSDVDVLSGIEGVIGTAFDDVLTGDAGANYLSGGNGGHDVLTGGVGDDTLVGGGYTLAYRDEADIVRGVTQDNKSMATAVLLDGAFDLVPHAGVSTAAYIPDAVTDIPHATVVAAATGIAGGEYYRFEATAGARGLFDIDDTNNYTSLEILDANGVVVASNYGTLTRDDGSRQGYDARLLYTFVTGGIYYVRVNGSSYDQIGRDLPATQFYTLNVSLEHAVTATPELRDAGSAVMQGGEGNDLIVASAGDDLIAGGVGVDTLSYINHYRGVAVDLGRDGAQSTGAGSDTITGIENLTGSHYADRLTGDAGDNILDGAGGSDALDGGDGRDTLSFASQTGGVTASLAAQGAAQTYRLGETVTATGFENLTGTAAADVLTGDAGANIVTGGAGDDTLSGGLVTVGIVDVLDGGAGIDTASFADVDRALVVTLGGRGAPGIATIEGQRMATLVGIENLVGGLGDDRLAGDELANVLTGGAGNDTLAGGRGDDVLDGGVGDDVLRGGDGTDVAVFGGPTAATVDLSLIGVQDTGYGRDMLIGIESLKGGLGNDRFFGNDGGNVFIDVAGDDFYDGRGGSDTVDYSAATTGLTVDLSTSGPQATGAGGIDTLVGIENVVGGSGRNVLVGDGEDNGLTGGAGADVLVGGLGGDVLVGGDGADALTGDGFGVGDDDDPTAMRDVLYGGGGNDTVLGGAGNDVLYGGAGSDFLSNGTFASSLTDGVFVRGQLIRADGGDDVIDGGEGDDFAVLSYFGRDEGVSVDVRDAAAINTIYSGGVAAGSITSVETLGFEGGSGDDLVYGGAGYDFLAGYDGNDRLYGGLGNDVIYGDLGSDILDGGGGFDTISFELATTGVTFDLEVQGVQDTGWAGVDTIFNFENVIGSLYGDTLYLNDLANFVNDSGEGDDSIYARGGDDSIYIFRSKGTASTVTMDGGEGNDRLAFYGGRATANGMEQVDTVIVNGGSGDEFISIADAKVAIVNAGAGDDFIGVDLIGATDVNSFRLTLGLGKDLVFLDADATSQRVERASNIITDFTIADDRLNITSLVDGFVDAQGVQTPGLTGYVSGDDPFQTGHMRLVQSGTSALLQIDQDGFLGSAGFVTVLTLENTVATSLTGANFQLWPFELLEPVPVDPSAGFIPVREGTEGGDLMLGTAGQDRLSGLGGNDRLRGFAGADVLIGGAGNDTLDGGAGIDRMFGGSGNDGYVVDVAGDLVVELAGEGYDTISTRLLTYTLGDNVEALRFLSSADAVGTGNQLGNTLYGNDGADRLDGGAGDDRLVGAGGDDNLIGGIGDDTLNGGNGIDRLEGGAGADYLLGGSGADVLMGGEDGDQLDGGSGADRIEGGAGSDRLLGGEGDDILIGGLGKDSMRGGAGADRFVFAIGDSGTGSNADAIVDFGDSDVIDLSGLGQLSFVGEGDYSASGIGEIRVDHRHSNTYVYADLDGNGTTDFALQLYGVKNLTAEDFALAL